MPGFHGTLKPVEKVLCDLKIDKSDSSRENKEMPMSLQSRKMKNPDLSTKLKLMGIDVSFVSSIACVKEANICAYMLTGCFVRQLLCREEAEAERTKERERSSATLLAANAPES
jgi:hypothetical protein